MRKNNIKFNRSELLNGIITFNIKKLSNSFDVKIYYARYWENIIKIPKG